MQLKRRLTFAVCAVSGLMIAGTTFAQAAPLAGVVQAAPSVVSTEASPGAGPLVQKAWWHRCWHCGWHWRRWHWHHWHRW